MPRRAIWIFSLLTAAACGDDGGEPAIFPEDYAATYTEVRNCRFSTEHAFVRVRILASPDSLAAYRDRTGPIPTGGFLVKEEYDGADVACEGPIEKYTVMQRLPDGMAPELLDYTWQEVNADFVEDKATEVSRCAGCHTGCGVAPEGHDGTCAVP